MDAAGTLFVADVGKQQVRKIRPDGSSCVLLGPAELSVPSGLAIDCDGSLYIADAGRHRVLRVRVDGSCYPQAGTGCAGFSGDAGPATMAQLHEPWGLAVDSHGSLYIADAGNHRIRRVAAGGTITTVAGMGSAGFTGDGGAATAAQLDRPVAVAVDCAGSLFIVDSLNGRIRKVGVNGVITTIFDWRVEKGTRSPSAGYYPARVELDPAGNLLIADPFRQRIIRLAGVAAPGLVGADRIVDP